MRKFVLSFLISILSCTTDGNPANDYSYSGNIYKLDINENPVSMHQFDFANGKNPKGNLFWVLMENYTV